MSDSRTPKDSNSSSPDSNHELPAAEAGASKATRSSNPHATADDTSGPRAREEQNVLVDRLSRMQGEFENARKRVAREQEEYKEFALGDALKSLLPVLDSFDRALLAPANDVEILRSGIELIRRQLHDA